MRPMLALLLSSANPVMASGQKNLPAAPALAPALPGAAAPALSLPEAAASQAAAATPAAPVLQAAQTSGAEIVKQAGAADGAGASAALAQTFDGAVPVPDKMIADGMPEIPRSLAAAVAPYLEMRSAAFSGWHPTKREMLIVTRFADAAQLHLVDHPGGARTQLTFLKEPVAGGSYQPKDGKYIVYRQDTGGGEFFQYYRLDPATNEHTLLTDGKSRNGGAAWARSGRGFAYTSTRRNGRDADLYAMDPADPSTNRLVARVEGGGWGVGDWSADEKTLVVEQGISANESRLHLVDVATGKMRQLAPADGERVSYGAPQFSSDGRFVYAVSTRGSEFHRIVRIDVKTGRETPLGAEARWGVEALALSPDGRSIAAVSNEDGSSVLRVLDARDGRVIRQPELPLGTIGALSWHDNGRDLAFTLSAAKTPGDVYSLDAETGRVERWTASETGGLNAASFREPELVRIPSFDGLQVSGFLYKPDPARFPGRRPVLINIHGGPEGQSRPGFQGRANYYLNELGVAVLFPNVRGSEGYGKTFLDLDNGYKREDSVKDIGAFLDWIKTQPDLDGSKIVVMGGSYGGYMTLASLVHYSEKLLGGIDVVGISNFVTFLEHTQEYRRDLRRVEYGDERDPKMRAFLESISPLNNSDKITRPLFVVQGLNDPRVPAGEAEQIVKAVRAKGRQVWYLLAQDEGHGFSKKKNVDYYVLAVIAFLSGLVGRSYSAPIESSTSGSADSTADSGWSA